MRSGRKKKENWKREGGEGTTERFRVGVEGLVLGEGEALPYLLGMIKMEKRADTISLIGT